MTEHVRMELEISVKRDRNTILKKWGGGGVPVGGPQQTIFELLCRLCIALRLIRVTTRRRLVREWKRVWSPSVYITDLFSGVYFFRGAFLSLNVRWGRGMKKLQIERQMVPFASHCDGCAFWPFLPSRTRYLSNLSHAFGHRPLWRMFGVSSGSEDTRRGSKS